MANVLELSDANFQSQVLQSRLPFLVDFWAPWCGPCRMIAPIVEELANRYTGIINFGKLNVDDNDVTAEKFRVSSIPTLMLFKNGDLADTMVGASKDALIRMLDKHK